MLYKLPKLKFLDSRAVKDEEKKEAERVGAFMKVITPVTNSSENVSSAFVSYFTHGRYDIDLINDLILKEV